MELEQQRNSFSPFKKETRKGLPGLCGCLIGTCISAEKQRAWFPTTPAVASAAVALAKSEGCSCPTASWEPQGCSVWSYGDASA